MTTVVTHLQTLTFTPDIVEYQLSTRFAFGVNTT